MGSDDAVQTVVRRIADDLARTIPRTWIAAKLVIPGNTVAAKIESPEGHAERVEPTRQLIEAMRALITLRRQLGQTWKIATILLRKQGATWEHAVDFAVSASGRNRALSIPATFPGGESSTLPRAVRERIEETVLRVETELANGSARGAIDVIKDALSLLPPPPHQWVEAGWLFNRAAGLHLGLDDAPNAVLMARHALSCTGWQDDPRALVRLAQAQLAAGDPGARDSIARAYAKGGHDWFAQVAPDLMHLLRS